MNVITYLRSPSATLIVLCSALLAQLPHAADVFRLIVVGDGLWPTLHSYTYAIALELAVLLFVVQRRNVESYAFAGVSILVNLSYYHLHGVQLLSVAALPAWLVSIALPAAIAQYSHLIAAASDAPMQRSAPDASPDDAPALHETPAAQHLAHDASPDDAPAQPDKRTQAMQLRDEGYTPAEITRMLNAKYSTVQSWLRRAQVQQNGANHE